MPLVLQGIDYCATNRYRDWKNELNEYFELNKGDALDLSKAQGSVLPDFSQAVWDKCIELFDSKEFRVSY